MAGDRGNEALIEESEAPHVGCEARCLRGLHSPTLRALIPALSMRKCSAPLFRQQRIVTVGSFWRHHSELQSETDQSSFVSLPIARSPAAEANQTRSLRLSESSAEQRSSSLPTPLMMRLSSLGLRRDQVQATTAETSARPARVLMRDSSEPGGTAASGLVLSRPSIIAVRWRRLVRRRPSTPGRP